MTSRVYAAVSLLSLVVAVVATAVGHLGLGPGYDPLTLTVSDYALSDRGTAIEVAMVVLALGAAALLAGFAASGARVRVWHVALVGVWSVGLIVAAIVPTDPITATTMSTAAQVHRYASVSAFVALPVAAYALARLGARTPEWGRTRRWVTWLCAVVAVGLGVFWYVAFPGDRVMMGLVERVLIGVELVMLGVLSVALLRDPRRQRSAAQPRSAVQPRHGGQHLRGHLLADPVAVPDAAPAGIVRHDGQRPLVIDRHAVDLPAVVGMPEPAVLRGNRGAGVRGHGVRDAEVAHAA